jgi:hypothetical protein
VNVALHQVAALTLLGGLSVIWGRGIFAVLLRDRAAADPLERWGFETAFGLGGFGTLLFALGVAGWLAEQAVIASAIGGSVFWWYARRKSRVDVGSWGIPRTVVVVTCLLVVPCFVLGLYPPIAFDETTYHLPLAAAFAHHHRLVVVPEGLFPVTPSLAETVCASLLLTMGDVSTHTVQLLSLLSVTALLLGAGARWGGWQAGAIAAALWLANPLVEYQGATSYVDLCLTMFCIVGVLAWEHWRDGGSIRWLVASGLSLGLAASVKHLGLPWLGLLALATLWEGPPRRRWSSAAILVGSALIAVAPWVARSLYETSDPVFPLFAHWFPVSTSPLGRLTSAQFSTPWSASSHYAPMHLDVIERPRMFLSAPWRMVFDRASFSHQPPLAPFLLVLLPLQIWFARTDIRLRRWFILMLGYAVLGTTTESRFQLPSVALLALAGGMSITRLLRHARLPEWIRRPLPVGALALMLAACGPAYAIYKCVKLGAIPANDAARERFLDGQLPGYRAVRFLNERCGSSYTLYGINSENLTYYTQGRFLGQRSGAYPQVWFANLLSTPEALHAALSRLSVDYLLLNHPRETGTMPAEISSFAAWFRPLMARPGPELFVVVTEGGKPRSTCAEQAPPSFNLQH